MPDRYEVRESPRVRGFRPPAREEFDELRDQLAAVAQASAARLTVIERALEAVIEDLDAFTEYFAADEPASDEPDPGPQAGWDDEAPEEEAQRLRDEAAVAFIDGNETTEAENASDFNDTGDVPEEGIDLRHDGSH